MAPARVARLMGGTLLLAPVLAAAPVRADVPPPGLVTAPADPEIPPPVRAMIEEAVRSGNAATIDAVVRVAKATNPEQAGAIAELVKIRMAEADTKTKQEREHRLAEQGYWQGWTGEGQVGFSLTSGNTNEVNAVMGLTLKKDGLHTRHKIDTLVDFLRTNGVTTREKFGASYTFDYLLREGFYFYGVGGWEQDRFAGYARRFTESLGIGLRVLGRPDMTMDIDAGPALRQTRFVDGTNDNNLGARASLAYKWTLSQAAKFAQDASIVSADGQTTFISNTSLTSKISGHVSGQVSFNVQTESNRPVDTKPTDTATRATLVYKF